jgi:hydrogenase maturation factor
MGPELLPGKLPPELLDSLLKRFASPSDPRVVVGPAYGEDAAVLEIVEGHDRYLVCKTDPVTFAAEAIGWYVVHVNANDIASMGATPKWFLPTVLLPEMQASAELAESIMADMSDAALSIGVSIVGGHTEITIGVDRPIVCGAMLGEVGRDRLITSDGGLPGDVLILTGGLGIEGTSVLARELESELIQDLGPANLESAKQYLYDPGISVVRHAAVAAGSGTIRAMHDPTEGGVATGVHELAAASGVGVVVWEEALLINDVTRQICDLLAVDPLGLIASGSLLIVAAPDAASTILSSLEAEGISAARIGALTAPGDGVMLQCAEGITPLRRFDRDEASRVLSDLLA